MFDGLRPSYILKLGGATNADELSRRHDFIDARRGVENYRRHFA